MDDLISWLREQIDEDERAASGMPADWSAYIEGGADGFAVEDCDGDWAAIIGSERQAHHIARHDPARVLREVKAKKQILHAHQPTSLGSKERFMYPEAANLCRVCGPGDTLRARESPCGRLPCWHLRVLASVYSDRPGYREEWTP